MSHSAIRDPHAPALILQMIEEERQRQIAKWGNQRHDDVDRVLTDRDGGCTVERMAEEYEIPTANRAKQGCENARGRQTWSHILIEEVAESIEAATELQLVARRNTGAVEEVYNVALEKELVQVAAVCMAWVEHLRARRA